MECYHTNGKQFYKFIVLGYERTCMICQQRNKRQKMLHTNETEFIQKRIKIKIITEVLSL